MGELHSTSRSSAFHDLTVELDAVGKRFDRKWVVRGISARVTRGEVLGIAGPNGSGKSTLIKMIATLLLPDQGEIRVSAMGSTASWPQRRPWIGWVSPEAGLYRALTGPEHVRFHAQLRGILVPDDSIRRVLMDLGLDVRPRTTVGAYSSGMAQRLRYACATIHRPPILLLDEPLMALDAEGTRMVQRVVEVQRERGVCVIAGNRDDELAMADRVLRIGAGGG